MTVGRRLRRLLFKVPSASHRFLYRASGGRLGATMRGLPILLLTTTGRKSGELRTTPLPYFADGDRMVLVAANGGRPANPDWYLNLRQTPRVVIETGGARRAAIAETAGLEERERLWPLVLRRAPFYGPYRHHPEREVPLVILRPTETAKRDEEIRPSDE